jgi:ATP-dependent helicase HrpB
VHTDLPISEVLPPLQAALESRDEVILEAPPGSGKTTIVPLALMDQDWLGYGKILVLEPRRLAARAAASRMAELLGETVGQTVGYRMRLDTRVSNRTKIEVITEGILTRMLQEDPSLEDVGLVIFDEFHERSLDADLGLAFCLKGREIFREENPLKILVMSATLDSDELARILDNAPVVRGEGRSYPVELHYEGAGKPRDRIVDRVVKTTLKALDVHPKSSFLVFLPGQGEIAQCNQKLADAFADTRSNDIELRPLFGNLSIEEQRAAIAPVTRPGHRKIVIATNIAETSLTIEDVDVVVDGGLVREPVYDPATGMTRLHTNRISRSSSIQRAGRAGRMRPGNCYRLWSEEQQGQLAGHSDPEILSADLASVALQLFRWGIDNPSELLWLDQPPPAPFNQALDLLREFGAIERDDDRHRLTLLGEQMAALPVHPRLAHLLIEGAKFGAMDVAANLAAVLSDRDPFGQETPDMSIRIDILSGITACPGRHRGWARRTSELARQFRSQVDSLGIKKDSNVRDDDAVLGYLIACAYPDRIARKRHGGGFQLANGRTANFAAQHYLAKSRWLAVAEVGGVARRKGDMIRSAAVLDERLFGSVLQHQVVRESFVEWDKREKRFVAETRESIGALVLKRNRMDDIPLEAKRSALLSMVRARGLPWTPELLQWQARVMLVRESVDGALPSVSDEDLTASLDEWLGPYLDPINSMADLTRLDIASILQHRLTFEQQREIDRLVPVRLEVPSGSSYRIDYTQHPPVLAVKLQEMFGCEETPAVLDGRIPLVVHLLSPAGRPLQITQDLAGFWRTTYETVKKEMKGRYPKHPWPDDPFEAQPTARTKKHL